MRFRRSSTPCESFFCLAPPRPVPSRSVCALGLPPPGNRVSVATHHERRQSLLFLGGFIRFSMLCLISCDFFRCSKNHENLRMTKIFLVADRQGTRTTDKQGGCSRTRGGKDNLNCWQPTRPTEAAARSSRRPLLCTYGKADYTKDTSFVYLRESCSSFCGRNPRERPNRGWSLHLAR